MRSSLLTFLCKWGKVSCPLRYADVTEQLHIEMRIYQFIRL